MAPSATTLLCASAMLLASSATLSMAAVAKDEVTALPGLKGALSSKQYSGYLEAGGGKHLHYWMVESENEPSKDPLVVWFNGGPGCSSLDGYFYEHGPYHVTEPIVNSSAGVPELYQNPYRWNKVANVMFLEAPAGVGFSYADTPAGIKHNDTSTAEDNLAALEDFFAGFPEMRPNEFFIAGESYAGAYVPMLAMQVLSHNKAVQQAAQKINLQGILVGNGVTGQDSIPGDVGAKMKVEFFFGHGLFNSSLHEAIVKECGDFKTPTDMCQSLQGTMHEQLGDVNVYDIYWPCKNGGMEKYTSQQLDATSEGQGMLGASVLALQNSRMQVGDKGPVGCIDASAAQVYLDTPAVQKAIHVDVAKKDWHICGGIQYQSTQGSLLPDYKNIIIPAIRVLIFNGDADCCVPYKGNEWWTGSLGVPLKAGGSWRQWTVDSQLAGYITSYQQDFSFLTVKGSGHMVPQFRPKPALAMFERFVHNVAFDCESATTPVPHCTLAE